MCVFSIVVNFCLPSVYTFIKSDTLKRRVFPRKSLWSLVIGVLGIGADTKIASSVICYIMVYMVNILPGLGIHNNPMNVKCRLFFICCFPSKNSLFHFVYFPFEL